MSFNSLVCKNDYNGDTILVSVSVSQSRQQQQHKINSQIYISLIKSLRLIHLYA